MGREQTVPVYMRTTGSTTADNTGYTEVQITAPQQCKIRRVRAEFAAGSTATQVGLQIREQPGVSTGLPVILAYALTPTNIDSLEDVYGASAGIPDPVTGDTQYVLYIGVTTNNAAVDTVNLSIDFEACA